jgi:hypothetical protein
MIFQNNECDEFCSFSPLFTFFRAAYTPSFALRAERRKTKRVKRGGGNSSHFKDRLPKMAVLLKWGELISILK